MATRQGGIENAADAVQRWFERNVPAMAFLAVMVAAWHLYATTNGRSNSYLPTPAFAVDQTAANTDVLLDGFQTTLTEMVTGYVLAIAFGVVMGILVSEVYTVRHMSMPMILFFHSIPLAILAPLFLGWFGTGLVGIGVYVAWGGFFPIFLNTITGLNQTPPEFSLLSDVTGATRWQRLRYIKIWTALPYITTGMKIAANMVVVAAIIAEFLASGSGLGHMLVFAEQRAQTGLMFGTVFIMLALGIVWFNGISYLLDFLKPTGG